MKKSLVRAVIALLAVSMLLCGCGGNVKEDGAVQTVTVWTNSSHTKDVAEKLIAAYNEGRGKEKGIKIEYTVHGADYQKVLDVAIQSDQAPDLFFPISGIYGYARKKALMPIEDMPGGEEFLKAYEGKLLPQWNIYEGKTYSVPYNLTTLGLVYNKDLFKENGIVDENGEAKAPTTWDEVAEYAKKCTHPEKDQYGIIFPLKWGGATYYEFINPFFSSLGTVGYDYDNNKFDYTALAPVFEWMMKIKNDESYYPGAEGIDNDPARAQFSEGNVAMKMAASWDVGVYNDQFPAKCDWGVAPIPSITGKPEYKQFCSTGTWMSVSSSVKDDKKEAVMDVYKWFHEDEFQIAMYENGKLIPADASIIEKAGEIKAAKGWVEFCSFAENSVCMPYTPQIALEGDPINNVMMKFWIGDLKIDEGLKDLTERSNAALDKENSKNPFDFSIYKWGDVNPRAE